MFAGNSGRIWRVCLKSRHSQKGVWQKAAAGIKKGDWRAWRRESVGSAGGDFRPAAGRAFTWKLSCVYPCTYKTVCPEVTICAENNGQEATIQHVQVKGSEMTMTNRTVLTESAMTNSTVVFQMVKKRQKMRVFDGFLHVFASCFAPQLVHLVRDQGSGIRDQRSGVRDQRSGVRGQGTVGRASRFYRSPFRQRRRCRLSRGLFAYGTCCVSWTAQPPAAPPEVTQVSLPNVEK